MKAPALTDSVSELGFKVAYVIVLIDVAGIQCEELPPLGNGSILYHIGTTFPVTIAMYTCEDGFFL